MGLCRLPGSALSLPGELPRALRGDVWGKEPPAGFVLPQLLPGAGGSQLHCTTECCKGALQEESQGRDFPFPVLREGIRIGGRNLKGVVNFQHSSETPKYFFSKSLVL